MSAEIEARIVDGKARLGMTFHAGLGAEVVGNTVSRVMNQLVGPYRAEMIGRWARVTFETCTAKMIVLENNGAFVVLFEFETMPPPTSEAGLIFAGCVDQKTGN